MSKSWCCKMKNLGSTKVSWINPLGTLNLQIFIVTSQIWLIYLSLNQPTDLHCHPHSYAASEAKKQKNIDHFYYIQMQLLALEH